MTGAVRVLNPIEKAGRDSALIHGRGSELSPACCQADVMHIDIPISLHLELTVVQLFRGFSFIFDLQTN